MKKIKLFDISKIIIPIASLFLFSQCMHDEFNLDKLDDEMEIVVGVLAPVAYGTLNIGDLISELDSSDFINTDLNGLLQLTYQDSLFSYAAEDMLEIKSQSFFEFFIQSDFAMPPLPIQQTFPIDRVTKFPFAFENGEKLDSMVLNSGGIKFDIESSFQHTAQVDLIIPYLQLDGVPFSRTFDIPVACDSTISFNIDNYVIYLQDSVDTDSMFFPVEFHVEVYTDGIHGIASSDKIDVNASLEDLNFSAIFGYIGNYELLGQAGDLDLGFFDNPMEGSIRFEDPKIKFNINNSYGVPAEINIDRFTGFNTDGDSVELALNSETNPFEYEYPDLTDYFNNDYAKETTLIIDATNSEISDLLALLPSRIEYNVSAASNPDSDTSIYNFVNDNSKIDVSFELILPLWFNASNFAFSDTLEDILGEGWGDDADIIDQINVMLEVSNGMPLDIDFQITFMDSLYNPVDTLFKDGSQPIIAAANIDQTSYEVLYESIKTSVIQYRNTDIERMKDARHAIIRAGLKTPTVNGNTVPVKFFDTYSIDFNLSISVNVKANTNDF